MYARRWGDNDRHLGPFLFAIDRKYKHLALLISSGGDDDDEGGCFARFSCYGFTLIVSLPQIIKPHSEWVDLTGQHWAHVRPDGRQGYTQTDERVFGFSYSEGFLQLKLGRSTGDSTTDRSKGYFLPWTQWRFVRHSLYDLSGGHFWTEQQRKPGERYDFEPARRAKEECPARTFAFKDFDGEDLKAVTRIEEREWKFGEGYFKWLSLFRPAKIRRSLDIEFSGETGRRKGSWKGGTMGHSIDMKPGELHEAAFRRYCAQNNMTFEG
ncbi:hypothetical protein [Rhizobium sp. BK456]|uniref:hypothetical protein n=1 Tax=Rhizobium sp. BK456 TaxID=2587007 RepID=UPI00161E0A4B|nr:hypothetical protein [Rhizobium sp. BK456]MBB3521062.1 hypothetical protein [Rhizobium sp. BK456]